MSYHHRYKLRDFAFAQRLLTQEAVALHVGVTEKAIRNWEGGSNYPREANLRKLIELCLDQLASSSQDGAVKMWELGSGQCLLILRSDRPYERMNISGVTGITEAQRASLKALGAVEEN
jgi:transcriptional regulator with XRE-family HTH domain